MMSPRFIVYLSLLLASAIAGFMLWRKLDRRYRLVTVMVAFIFVTEYYTRYLISVSGSSMPVYHLVILSQLIFYWQIYRTKSPSKFSDGAFLLLILFSNLNSLLFQSLEQFPSNALICLSFAVIASALLDLKYTLEKETTTKIWLMPDFWFNLGGLSFFSLTFFAFSLMNIGMAVLPNWVYDLIFAGNILIYVCYGCAIFLNSRRINDESDDNHH